MGSAETDTVTDDSPSTDEPPIEPPPRRWRDGSSFSPAAIGVALVFVFGIVKLALPLGRAFTTFGDIAYIELGVRQALHHGNALGVYSRFGWHHPGPALFYLMAPWYWMSGDSSRSLFLGAWLINGASALGAVWIVRARADEWAARLMTIVLFASVLVFGFRHFIDPWNPKLLALPVLLLMVSAAASYSGSAWAFVVALVAASYLVQTHLGTFPISVALLVLGAFGFTRNWLRPAARPETVSSRPSRRAPLMVAIGLLTLMWIAPVVQEVTNHDGNLSQIVSFYAHPPAGEPASHSLSSSFVVVSNQSTVVPLGVPKDTHGHRSRLLTAGAFAALGLAAAVVARRRAPFIAALGLTTTIGLAVAVLAASRVVGPQDTYLFYWTEMLPLPAIVAGGWLVLDRLRSAADHTSAANASPADTSPARPPFGLAVSVVSALAVVVLLGGVVRSVAHASATSIGDGPRARIITAHIELELGDKRRPFTLHDEVPKLSDPGALSVQLDKDGYHFHLDPTVNLYRGNITAPVAGPTFVVRAATPTPVTGPGERFVATVGKIEVVERT